MKFWIDWALWQKLSAVLALLLAIVLIYSFCVLAYNRRMIKKYAAAEAYQRAAQDSELQMVATGGSDIPFGARALEKGVKVDGIWISNSNASSPVQSATPMASRSVTPMGSRPQYPLSTYDTLDVPAQWLPEQLVPNAARHDSRGSSRIGNDNMDGGRPGSIQPNSFKGGLPIPPDPLQLQDSQKSAETEKRWSRGWFGPRSSWITKSSEKDKRKPDVEGEPIPSGGGSCCCCVSNEEILSRSLPLGRERRQSSEDFRRRISRLIEESIQTRPREEFQLRPIPTEDKESGI
ncbi:uncharacterized protein ACLA_025120 [Aspergillus clavatus NRRL 1]|uniref:Uncharacterized protein n=1 Tax=Aspergillus clavatus (strain ATCC 1007 / CBS 513.65 / DSM 816 / NCTC 3887 / NRRL 1 / QM 1276 / 107) TaxID=344612 RepID=A1CQ74_ASPCL|nr:uncharacterized protein ACLA_025120 [Aspergillus clavatus NRRL 1]EAW07795.1 conserved hypothetical protein [Aspergillus clavatus NRRL 1]